MEVPKNAKDAQALMGGVSGFACDSVVEIDADLRDDSVIAFDASGKAISSPVFIILGHELIHAEHIAQGQDLNAEPTNKTGYPNKEELSTIESNVVTENMLRHEHGLKERITHQATDLRSKMQPKLKKSSDLITQDTPSPDGSFHIRAGVKWRIARSKDNSALLTATRAEMKPHFGTDFSDTQVHADGEATGLNQALSARALMHDSNEYFGEGQFAPRGRERKKWLLADAAEQNGDLKYPHSIGITQSSSATMLLQRQHFPSGPYHPPDGISMRCTEADDCSQLSHKINYLRHTIASHKNWDINHPMPEYPSGRHMGEIRDLENALENCIQHTRKCRGQPKWEPVPEEVKGPQHEDGATRRIATAAAMGGGIGMILGGLLGAVGGGAGGTLVAPGVGTIGGGAAGGIAGAAKGAAVGGLIGGAVMGSAEALWELINN